jgi:hypothetical protein
MFWNQKRVLAESDRRPLTSVCWKGASNISRSEELSERQAVDMAREILELAEEQFPKKRDEERGATPTHLHITSPSTHVLLDSFLIHPSCSYTLNRVMSLC